MQSNQNERLKLCPHCDGRVLMEVSVCPYCGNVFTEKKDGTKEDTKNTQDMRSLSPEETLASLYPPPYRPKMQQAAFDFPKESIAEEVVEEKVQVQEKEISSFPYVILFSIGINIGLLGLFLFFFAHNGEVILRWNAKFWIVYLIVISSIAFFLIRIFY
jgi:hypothetical protein